MGQVDSCGAEYEYMAFSEVAPSYGVAGACKASERKAQQIWHRDKFNCVFSSGVEVSFPRQVKRPATPILFGIGFANRTD